jgi:protein-arginine kinase activator protein McsA
MNACEVCHIRKAEVDISWLAYVNDPERQSMKVCSECGKSVWKTIANRQDTAIVKDIR